MSWTVIIPAYGAREVLARCLESVIAHVAGNVTVYLADDASPGDPLRSLSSTLARRLVFVFSLFDDQGISVL